MKQRDNHIDKTKTIGTLKFQWFDDGADDENRTRNASLGSWSFTTKLHPHISGALSFRNTAFSSVLFFICLSFRELRSTVGTSRGFDIDLAHTIRTSFCSRSFFFFIFAEICGGIHRFYQQE